MIWYDCLYLIADERADEVKRERAKCQAYRESLTGQKVCVVSLG